MERTKKSCLVCQKEFMGTTKQVVCSGACRTKLSRMKPKPTFQMNSDISELLEADKRRFNAPPITNFTFDEPKKWVEASPKNITGDGKSLRDILEEQGYKPADKPKPYKPKLGLP